MHGQRNFKISDYSLGILKRRQTEATRKFKNQYEESTSQVLVVQFSIWIFCNLVFNNLYTGTDTH
jgi:hypothetical protein